MNEALLYAEAELEALVAVDDFLPPLDHQGRQAANLFECD